MPIKGARTHYLFMTSNNNMLKAQLRDGRAALNCWGSEMMCGKRSYIYSTFDDQMVFLIKRTRWLMCEIFILFRFDGII